MARSQASNLEMRVRVPSSSLVRAGPLNPEGVQLGGTPGLGGRWRVPPMPSVLVFSTRR